MSTWFAVQKAVVRKIIVLTHVSIKSNLLLCACVIGLIVDTNKQYRKKVFS